jgi:hypothetical protein
MRRLIFTLIIISFAVTVNAQQTKKKTYTGPWKKGGMVSFYLNQGGSRNWAAGADKFSLAFTGYMNLWANRLVGKNDWQNSVDIGYSLINSHTVGVRKNYDKLDAVSKYSYQITKTVGVGFFLNLRTQLTNGFDYSENPKRRISGFFAPAYAIAAPGVHLNIIKNFTIFATPAAAKWVIVTNRPYSFNFQGGLKPDSSTERSLASQYGVDPRRQIRFEVGPFVSLGYHKDICKNVNYRMRADFQSDLTNQEPFNIDIFWTNMVNMSVNKWLKVSYNFDLIYDDNVKMFGRTKTGSGAQLNSMFGIGVSAKF